MRRLPVLVALTALTAASACSSSPASAPPPLQGKTAAQVITAAQAAAKTAGSVHLEVTENGPNGSQGLIGDLSTNGANVKLTGPNGQFVDFILVGGVLYVQADATDIASELKVTPAAAAGAAGKWVSVQGSDAPYATLAAILNFTSDMGRFIPASTGMTLVGPKHVHGVAVVELTGPVSATGYTGTTVFDVAAANPTVPLDTVVTASQGEQITTQSATFSNWGKALSLTAPAGAVTYTSLAAG